MKKGIIFLLIILVVLSLCACGQSGSDKVENASTVSSVDKVTEAKEKLKRAYELYGHEEWQKYKTYKHAVLSEDGLSLQMDSDPYDTNVYQYSSDIISAIFAINEYLSLPNSLSTKMQSTRALDGMQSQDCGEFTVTWTYHPENGLNVIYEVNQ